MSIEEQRAGKSTASDRSEVVVSPQGLLTSARAEEPGNLSRAQWRAGRPGRVLGVVIDRFGVIVVWCATIAIFGALSPSQFLSTGNLSAILGTQAVLLILSLALMIPFIVGEFDLSVAGTLGVGYVLMGYLTILHHWPVYAAILVAIAAGLLVGAVNALITVRLGAPSIVVTLGMGTLLFGIGYGLLSEPVPGLSPSFVSALSYQILDIPLPFYIGLVLTVVVWYILRYTPLGRYMYFTGMNKRVARLSGLRVDRIRAGSFIIAAFISVCAGIILAGSTGASDPDTANSYLLPVFAAVFLGATSIEPGRFNAWGTFIAVYFLTTGVTGLQILGVNDWITQVFYGAALVIAVTITRITGREPITIGASG
jgi:ribose transport system permease protein